MSLENDLLAGLNAAKSMSSASMSYLSGSTTVSASVYVSFSHGIRYETDEYNYQKTFLDKSVIAKTSDISAWSLEPKKSKVTIDGVNYLVGGLITYNPYLTWISLRIYSA